MLVNILKVLKFRVEDIIYMKKAYWKLLHDIRQKISELRIFGVLSSKLSPKDLESFFTTWKNRIPTKSLCLSIPLVKNEDYEENMKIIEKYKNLGTIKKFS